MSGTTRKYAMGTGWKRVFQPVPPNQDQWCHPKTPGFSPGALGIHWYRLERPTITTEAATLTQAGSPFGTGWSFQLVPMIFPPISQILFYLFYLLLFILL